MLDEEESVFITGGAQQKPTFRDRCLPWRNRHVRGLVVTVPIEDWASSSSYHLAVNAPLGCIVAPLYACYISTKDADHPKEADVNEPPPAAESDRPADHPKEADVKETPLKLDVGNTVPFSVRLSATIPGREKLPLDPAYSLKSTNIVRAIIEPVHHGTTRMIFGIVIVLGIVSLVYEVTGVFVGIHKSSSLTLSSAIVILALLAMGAPLLITAQRDALAERLMFFSKAMFVQQGAWTVLFILYGNLFAGHLGYWDHVIPGLFAVGSVVTCVLIGSHYLRLKRFAEVMSLSESQNANGARRSHFYAKCVKVDSQVGALK
jgi:hypothetical protein